MGISWLIPCAVLEMCPLKAIAFLPEDVWSERSIQFGSASATGILLQLFPTGSPCCSVLSTGLCSTRSLCFLFKHSLTPYLSVRRLWNTGNQYSHGKISVVSAWQESNNNVEMISNHPSPPEVISVKYIANLPEWSLAFGLPLWLDRHSDSSKGECTYLLFYYTWHMCVYKISGFFIFWKQIIVCPFVT